jgi:hypothetical protein
MYGPILVAGAFVAAMKIALGITVLGGLAETHTPGTQIDQASNLYDYTKRRASLSEGVCMCTDQRGIPDKVPSAMLVLLLALASELERSRSRHRAQVMLDGHHRAAQIR